MTQIDKLLKRLDSLFDRIEPFIPELPEQITEFNGGAYDWHNFAYSGCFRKIVHSTKLKLDDLQCIESQKEQIVRNTQQFLSNLPANNILLWGAKGTGKSSLIKALLNQYASKGLNLIEIEKKYVIDFKRIIEELSNKQGHFILYCDDLSFGPNNQNYKEIKAVLDGSLSGTSKHILIYATSNRRHLLPETMRDNLKSEILQDELHLNESIDEKISLSERFGIRLAFHPFNQEQYLKIVDYWLHKLGYNIDDRDSVQKAAIKWALEHGSRSGRSAWQFAKDWTGQQKLNEINHD